MLHGLLARCAQRCRLHPPAPQPPRRRQRAVIGATRAHRLHCNLTSRHSGRRVQFHRCLPCRPPSLRLSNLLLLRRRGRHCVRVRRALPDELHPPLCVESHRRFPCPICARDRFDGHRRKTDALYGFVRLLPVNISFLIFYHFTVALCDVSFIFSPPRQYSQRAESCLLVDSSNTKGEQTELLTC